MKIKPLGKRVLIEKIKQEEVTKSGIVLPGTASKEKPIMGEVIAVGLEIKEISEGMTVIFEKYSGTEIKDGDIEYLIMEEKDVLAIVE